MGINNLKNQLTSMFSKLSVRDKNTWVFGAWLGGNFSDNPKSFLEYMLEKHPENKYYWIINDLNLINAEEWNNVTFLRKYSKEANKIIRKAGYAVFSHGSSDLSRYNLIGGAKKLQLYHGLAWKCIGMDAYVYEKKYIIDKLKKINAMWFYKLESQGDYYIAPSDITKNILKTAFMAKDNQIIKTGQPRNKIFYNKGNQFKEKILNELGIKNMNKKIVLYLPTFRDSGRRRFSFFDNINKLKDIGRFETIIIEKGHFAEKNQYETLDVDNILYSGKQFNTQELLASADVLITDYSGCIFDYLILDKPIIQFVYDINDYMKSDRKMYFTVEEMDCGYMAYSAEKLFEFIEMFINNCLNITDKQINIKRKYITYENENSSAIIYDTIVKK